MGKLMELVPRGCGKKGAEVYAWGIALDKKEGHLFHHLR